MKIVVNGDEEDIERGTTVGQLVSRLNLKSDRLAIEVNRRILRKRDWDSTKLAEADTIEIVSFVGGGAPGSRQDSGFGFDIECEDQCTVEPALSGREKNN